MNNEYRLNKSTLRKIRKYAKKIKYNVFLDNKEKKTCLYSKRSKKRVFVKMSENGDLVAVDDNNNEEIISSNIDLCLNDRLRLNHGKHTKMREVVYGVISLF